ncbi:MAG: mannose-1-phosphate guanylyltransferase [Gemmatimonadaceae bacterium]
MTACWGVVLAGGIGSRFWPLSTPSRPKQLLPLVDAKPLLVNTIERFAPLIAAERTLILTAAPLVRAIHGLLPAIPAENLIAEPKPAGTAAALTWAALEIARRTDKGAGGGAGSAGGGGGGGGGDAIMVSVHADWAIGDAAGFRDCLTRAAKAAVAHQALVTVGVVPNRPDSGFGYIEPGAAVDSAVRRVARFIEKPDRERAGALIAAGGLWNSGIFVWRVGDFLDDVARLTPEVAPSLAAHSADAAAFFAGVQPVSVDVGVLERSDRVLVLPGDFGWDDIGTWSALRRVRLADAAGNASSGDVHAVDASDNVVHAADGVSVVLYGVRNLVVVAQRDLTLVTNQERAADLKELLSKLPPALRDRR